jgi:ABC-type transport system involved in multi-copper enzyme maturation permease subunit
VFPVGCDLKSNAWYEAQNGVAGLSMGVLIFLSFAAGLFLGVPIVARELERGTARLAWSLAPSRMRWYLSRMLPVLIVLALITFVAGIAADRYVASTTAETDLANSFTNFGFRGLLIASRAVFLFAVGVAVGSIVGRALPAVILAAVIATIGLAGGERVHQMILASEAVVIPADQNGNNNPRQGDLFIDQKFVLPDGALVDYGYFGGADPYDLNGNPKYPIVNLVVPGERYRFVETREALALAAGSLVALLLAGFVVSRRRPG